MAIKISGSTIIDDSRNIISAEVVTATSAIIGTGVTVNSSGINVTGVVTATTFSGNLPTTDLTGTITNAQLAGSIANSKLVNDSVSFGGVSLDLGASDATPAFNLSDATAYPTSSLVGTITNAQLAGSIANSKLVNDSVSYGGVSLDLGQTDATPAFDLSDATNYPTSSLTGTITNAQLAGSIADGKLASTFLKNVVEDTTPQLGGSLDLNGKFITGTGGINVSGVVTATTFSGSGANLTSIPNGALTNSSIAIGGVTLNLGDTDATPAFDLSDATAYPTSSLTGTITNAQLAGSIANAKLANDSVSFGGVSLDLGGTDATPAFNLSDATAYPTSSLSGTITNAQLAGSIANSKLANSTMSVGGVTLTLGATDATPAFDLSDATAYPTSSLSGTITNAQLAGSIADGKLASTFLKNVVEDTTPQLGGNLDFNSKFITGTGGINVTGVVTATSFSGSGANLTGLTANQVGALGGFTVRDEGSVVGSAGSVGNINFVSGNLTATASGVGATVTLTDDPTFNNITIADKIVHTGDTNTAIRFPADDTVTVETGGTERLRITSAGLVRVPDNGKFTAGAGDDLQIYHDSSTNISYIKESGTGRLEIRGSDLYLADEDGTNMLYAANNGGVSLYNSGGKKLETTGIGISIAGVGNTAYIEGPSEIWIDPHPFGVGQTSGSVRIRGDLYVDGTEFIVDVDKIELGDFNIGIASTVSTNSLLDGAGLGIGATSIRKFITWNNATSALMSSENWNLASGKHYEINGTDVLTSNTLGSGIINSSLTSVGTLGALTVSGDITANGNIVGDNSTNISGINSVTATLFHGSGANLTSIPNSALANDSVSFGGVSVDLGASDATPAFDLSDATAYPTSSLVGTITNAQLAGSIANSKLVNDSVSFGGVSLDLGASDATPAFDLSDATAYPTSSLVGTITNAQLAGSIANAKLANSTMSVGGVTLTLGATDATPAFNLSDATNYPTSSLSGTITNAQLAGSIANAKLANDSVSFGGVSLDLGASDATPAFNLSDATNYPTSSLSGTITNAQLAGSIADGKLASTFLKNVVEDTTPQLGGNLDFNSKFITGTGGINVSGVVTATSFSGSGASLTSLNASNLGSGTIPDARFPATLPAVSGANLTNLPGGVADKIEEGNTSAEVIDTGSDGRFIVTTEGTERLRITSAGLVGIGTDNPTNALEVKTSGTGVFKLITPSEGGVPLIVAANANTASPSNQFFVAHSGASVNVGNARGGNLNLYTSNAERLRITSAGLVGIGTDNPQSTLEVNVGTAVSAFDIQGSAGQLFSVTNNLTSGSIFSVNDVSGIPSIDVDADGTIQLAPFGANENIGIGTTNPTSKLDVVGDAKVSGVITATSFSGDGSNLTNLPAGSTIPVADESSDTTCFPVFTTAATGNQAPKTGTNLTFNSSNGTLTATTFSGNLPTSDLTGTITNAQLAGSIANAKLANDSVSFGGVSLDLGASDATPAFDLSDATAYPTSSLVGTITNAQLAGSIANAKLANSTMSVGGVTLTLGATDATPAFDLSDATAYPTSSLVGTITNAQLAGSIANAKLANSTMSVGGVTLTLGATDATPAFDLSDATAYPTSSLSGTITNAQLAGSIADGKLASTFLKNVVEDTTPQLGGNLDFNSKFITGTGGINVSGVVTATSFVGDGSALTNLPASAAGGGDKYNTGITTSIYVSVTGGIGTASVAANNDIFTGPGIAYTFPSTAGKSYIIESISVTNIYDTNLYFSSRHDFNGGQNTPTAQRVVIPYQGALEVLEEPIIAKPSDILRFQAFAGIGTLATGVNNGLDSFITYSEKTDANFIGVGTIVTTASGTELFTSTTNSSVIQSIRLCNYSLNMDTDASVSIYRGGTVGSIPTTGVRQGYLVYNLTVPKNSVIEILERPKYLPPNDTVVVGMDGESISATLSGKYIT